MSELYEFEFTLTTTDTQKVVVQAKDREAALAYATGLVQAEQRGEKSVQIELTDESSREIQTNYAVNTKRPVGDGGKDIYGRRRSD